jgi:hypothetical protein
VPELTITVSIGATVIADSIGCMIGLTGSVGGADSVSIGPAAGEPTPAGVPESAMVPVAGVIAGKYNMIKPAIRRMMTIPTPTMENARIFFMGLSPPRLHSPGDFLLCHRGHTRNGWIQDAINIWPNSTG